MSNTNFLQLVPHIDLLNEAVKFGRVGSFMVESDLQERQTNNIIFNLDTAGSGPNQPRKTYTGLASDEKLIEEALIVHELLLISQMLQALILFDTCQNEQGHLKRAECKLLDSVNFCKLLLDKLGKYQALFETQQQQQQSSANITGSKLPAGIGSQGV